MEWRAACPINNRLLNIPLNQIDYNSKVNTIKYIAQENVCDSQVIESLINNAKWKKSQTSTKETPTDLPIDCCPHIHLLEKMYLSDQSFSYYKDEAWSA